MVVGVEVSAEVVGIAEVEEVVASEVFEAVAVVKEERAPAVAEDSSSPVAMGSSPSTRVPSTLTFHQESGRGVGSIISTGPMRTSVRNRRPALGRM